MGVFKDAFDDCLCEENGGNTRINGVLKVWDIIRCFFDKIDDVCACGEANGNNLCDDITLLTAGGNRVPTVLVGKAGDGVCYQFPAQFVNMQAVDPSAAPEGMKIIHVNLASGNTWVWDGLHWILTTNFRIQLNDDIPSDVGNDSSVYNTLRIRSEGDIWFIDSVGTAVNLFDCYRVKQKLEEDCFAELIEPVEYLYGRDVNGTAGLLNACNLFPSHQKYVSILDEESNGATSIAPAGWQEPTADDIVTVMRNGVSHVANFGVGANNDVLYTTTALGIDLLIPIGDSVQGDGTETFHITVIKSYCFVA